jgi:hypothetical protein
MTADLGSAWATEVRAHCPLRALINPNPQPCCSGSPPPHALDPCTRLVFRTPRFSVHRILTNSPSVILALSPVGSSACVRQPIGSGKLFLHWLILSYERANGNGLLSLISLLVPTIRNFCKSNAQLATCLLAGSLIGTSFDLEGGGDMFRPNCRLIFSGLYGVISEETETLHNHRFENLNSYNGKVDLVLNYLSIMPEICIREWINFGTRWR